MMFGLALNDLPDSEKPISVAFLPGKPYPVAVLWYYGRSSPDFMESFGTRWSRDLPFSYYVCATLSGVWCHSRGGSNISRTSDGCPVLQSIDLVCPFWRHLVYWKMDP